MESALWAGMHPSKLSGVVVRAISGVVGSGLAAISNRLPHLTATPGVAPHSATAPGSLQQALVSLAPNGANTASPGVVPHSAAAPGPLQQALVSLAPTVASIVARRTTCHVLSAMAGPPRQAGQTDMGQLTNVASSFFRGPFGSPAIRQLYKDTLEPAGFMNHPTTPGAFRSLDRQEVKASRNAVEVSANIAAVAHAHNADSSGGYNFTLVPPHASAADKVAASVPAGVRAPILSFVAGKLPVSRAAPQPRKLSDID